jgi:hypothetical protein
MNKLLGHSLRNLYSNRTTTTTLSKIKKKMALVANITCLLSLFASLENKEKWELCEGGLCLCQATYEPQCVTEEIIKVFCLPVSFFS